MFVQTRLHCFSMEHLSLFRFRSFNASYIGVSTISICANERKFNSSLALILYKENSFYCKTEKFFLREVQVFFTPIGTRNMWLHACILTVLNYFLTRLLPSSKMFTSAYENGKVGRINRKFPERAVAPRNRGINKYVKRRNTSRQCNCSRREMASDKAKSKVNTRRLFVQTARTGCLVKQPRHGLLCINTTERRVTEFIVG